MAEAFFALCTPPVTGALHVFRVCGAEAFAVVSAVSRSPLKQAPGLQHGFVVDGETVVDEVVFAKFVAPKSYTGEHTVEISCHGGMTVANEIARLLLRAGARHAERGEFTKTALLNGKLDLVQAEAVNDLVNAPTAGVAANAAMGLTGKTSALVEGMRSALLDLVGVVEVNIDYPEYDDVEHADAPLLARRLRSLLEGMNELIDASQAVIPVLGGIRVAIVGLPNAGKSSLLNALLGHDRAIVSPVAGTTRDVVEATASLAGVPVTFLDTAGIRKAAGKVETMGIDRSKRAIKEADLVFLVVDVSKKPSAAETELASLCPEGKTIVVGNKSDLLKGKPRGQVLVAAGKGEVEPLVEAVKERFAKGLSALRSDSLHNGRQLGLMQKARDEVADGLAGLSKGETVDLVAERLQRAHARLSELVGKSYREDMINELFARFCLGK